MVNIHVNNHHGRNLRKKQIQWWLLKYIAHISNCSLMVNKIAEATVPTVGSYTWVPTKGSHILPQRGPSQLKDDLDLGLSLGPWVKLVDHPWS